MNSGAKPEKDKEKKHVLVALVSEEASELQLHAEAVDCPVKGTLFGKPIAGFTIPATCSRAELDDQELRGGPARIGWSYLGPVSGPPEATDLPEETARRVVVLPGCSPSLKAKLQAALPPE